MTTLKQRHTILNMPKRQRQLIQALVNGLLSPLAKGLDRIGLYEKMHRQLNHGFPLANIFRPSFHGYDARPEDIFVCTYPKSGTNWMLQIAYQLTYHAQGEYDHIHDVVPWPDGESLPAVAINDMSIASKSPTGKRVIKTHLAWDALPYHPDARYIVVIRDPKAVFVSSYHFVQDVALGAMMPSFQTWYQLFIRPPFMLGSWAQHIASYWSQRHLPNVLIVSYEQMQADSPAIIRQVADFVGIPASDELIQQIHQLSDFRFMQNIDHKFHPGPALPFSPATGFMMRQGATKQFAGEITPAQQAEIDRTMQAQLQILGSDFPYQAWYG